METEIDKIVADNTGLIYKQLYKLHMQNDDDAFSIGLEALANAAVTFDDSKNIRFSTYASVCIYNALGNYLRRINKKHQLEVVSYYEPVAGSEDITFIDILSTAPSPTEEYLRKELYAKLWEAFDKICAELPSSVERYIVSSWRESEFTKSQATIAEEAGVSQAHVSRTLSAFKHKLKKELEEYLC